MTVKIIPERAEDAALIDPLLDRTFGPERKAKTVYRLRRGLAPIAALSFIAIDGHGQGLASLRFWPIRIEAQRDVVTTAILLGPLAVEPDLQGQGLGRALIEAVADAAKQYNASQVYWLTQHFNQQARHLYDQVADVTPFVKYTKAVP